MGVFSFEKAEQSLRSDSEIISEELCLLKKEELSLREGIQKETDRVDFLNAEIRRIRKEMQEHIDKLATERGEIEEGIFDTRRRLREIESEISNLEKKLKLALDRERQKREFEERRLEFEKISAGFAWREFALTHQLDGAHLLANVRRGILADKMRLGKTLTSLITCDMLQSQRVLIVAPADVVTNFAREVHRWAPHRSAVTMYKFSKGQREATIMILKRTKEFVVLMNYEAWRRDKSLVEDLVRLRFDTVILDEAHAIKNTSTDAFKGISSIVFAENCCPLCSGAVSEYSASKYEHYMQCDECTWDSRSREHKWEVENRRSVKNVIPMTGTPILNRPEELFPLLNLILPEIFYDKQVYLNLYCNRNRFNNKWEFRPGALVQLEQHLAGRYIARDRKAAGVTIPKQEIQYHNIPITELMENYPNQWRIIQQISKHAQIILESTERKMEMIATITVILRKRQANVWPAGITMKDGKGDIIFSVADDTTESIKIDKSLELLGEICQDGMSTGDRAVVFSQFKGPLHALSEKLNAQGISAVVFDGDTPEYLREQIKADFDGSRDNSDPRWQVVCCNYKTGGVGLNFSAATHVIALDKEWNPGKNEQAWARVESFSGTEETTVHILNIEGTIDTWMENLNAEKADIVAGVESMASNLLEAMHNGEIV
jgi:SNF2 family DNA or RNA helicase